MGPGKWSSATATQKINRCANSDELSLSWTHHAREQMFERGLIMSDILHVLRLGFVYEEAQDTTRPHLFKYIIEATTPNSDGRTVGLVVIPDGVRELKLVTVMWRDPR